MDSADRNLLEAQLSAYLDGELSPEQVAEIERQLASDPDAQATFDSLRRTVQLIRTLPRHPAPPGVLDDLTAAAERNQLLDPSGESATWRATRWEDVRSLLATAAVVVITVGAGLWFAARNGDTGHLADGRTPLVQTTRQGPVERPATPMAPPDLIEEGAIEIKEKRNTDGLSAGPRKPAPGRAAAKMKSAVPPSPIALQPKHTLAEGDTLVARSAVRESVSLEPRPPVSGAVPQVWESSLAPASNLGSAHNNKPIRLDVSSTVFADSVAPDDSAPASIGDSPREHVLPLSFVCAGTADRQACELGLRNYIRARAQRDLARVDSATGSSSGRAKPSGRLGVANKRRQDHDRNADKDHSQASEFPQADRRLLKQGGAAKTDSYRVRVPASELLDLIDQVSAAAKSEVVPELELGPFRAVGRGRIEQLVNDSNYHVARETPGDSEVDKERVEPAAESSAASARVAGDVDGDADPVVQVDGGVPRGPDHGPTSSDRATRRRRAGAARGPALGVQQTETPPAGDAQQAPNMPPNPDLQADSNSPIESEPGHAKQTPVRDPWITLVIRFLDRGEPDTPVRAQLESSLDPLDGGVNGELSVSTREEVQQDVTAGEPPAPATSNENANSSP